MRGRDRYRRGRWALLAALAVAALLATTLWSRSAGTPDTDSRSQVSAGGDSFQQAGGTAEPAAVVGRGRPALVLVEEAQGSRPGMGNLRAHPVDPRSLADLEGYEAINLGHHYTYAVSPDGRTLAAIVWHSGSPVGDQSGVLRLVDLSSWTTVTAAPRVGESVTGPVFSGDSQRLYWLEPGRRDPAHGIPRAYRLMRYTLTTQTVTPLAELPDSFIPYQVRLLRSGEQVAVYGLPTSTGNLAEDVPHVLILDLTRGQTVADVRLEGVRAGQFRVAAEGGDQWPYELFLPGLGWDIPRDRLYVAHADSNRLSVVDLAAGTVTDRGEARPKQSWIDRLLRRLSGTASAKMVPTSERHALVSPNGDRIYVMGTRVEMYKDGKGEWNERTIPLGLQVIDTESMTEIHRADLPLNGITLSADGRWLLGQMLPVAGGPGSGERHQLSLFAAKTMEEHHTWEVTGGINPSPEMTRAGLYLYFLGFPDSGTVRQRSYRVFDLNTLSVVSEREVTGFVDLIELAPQASDN